MESFKIQLESLINRNCLENASNTQQTIKGDTKMNYNTPVQFEHGATLASSRETLRERLYKSRDSVKENLANIEKAIAFLDQNKGFEEFHDLVGRVGF